MKVRDFHPEGGKNKSDADIDTRKESGVLGKPLKVRTRKIRIPLRVDIEVLVAEPPVADDDLVVGSMVQHITRHITAHKQHMVSGVRVTDLREPEEDVDDDEDDDLLVTDPEYADAVVLDVDDVDPDEPWE